MNRPSLPRLLCALLLGALLATPGASAAVLTFETVNNVVTPQLAPGDTAYNTGDRLREAGFIMHVGNSASADPGDYGLVGARINGADPASCINLRCPSDNSGHYFAVLNDGVFSLERSDALGFRLEALRFALLAPLTGFAGAGTGQLVLTGIAQGGATVTASMDFGPPDLNGNYNFTYWSLAGAFGNTVLASLSASACLYDGAGACIMDHMLNQNQAQFAIDDLQISVVPEPSTWLMLMLGLGALLWARRASGAQS
jgi:hypothetical protein